ncbi:hypothetical protein HDU76_002351 [Blyttiomyces sp. JEL0837]|nr:hypothetical protein HDU76_002351 [Blyttiomyces sp. JEL0837]
MFGVIKQIFEKDPPTARKRRDYKIIKKLGEGTYGIVEEAIHLPSGEKRAIKTIKKKPMQANPRAQAMVHREMTILTGLEGHENVIKMYDWYETKDKYCLVFELATGGELFDRLVTRGRFTERDAADIIFQILHAISYLHSNNIVHRDLKPENLLYRSEKDTSEIVIADFGVSNVVEEGEILKTLCGSPAYAAPEVIKRVGHGKPADLWSVGYGPWYYCEDLPSMLDAVSHGRWKFESPWADAVSIESKAFIRSLLQMNPTDRPTARQAMLAPWILKYSRRAQNYLANAQKSVAFKPTPVLEKQPVPQDLRKTSVVVADANSSFAPSNISRSEAGSPPPPANVVVAELPIPAPTYIPPPVAVEELKTEKAIPTTTTTTTTSRPSTSTTPSSTQSTVPPPIITISKQSPHQSRPATPSTPTPTSTSPRTSPKSPYHLWKTHLSNILLPVLTGATQTPANTPSTESPSIHPQHPESPFVDSSGTIYMDVADILPNAGDIVPDITDSTETEPSSSPTSMDTNTSTIIDDNNENQKRNGKKPKKSVLPNLLETVWAANPKSTFLARMKLKSAMIAVEAVHVFEEAVGNGSDDDQSLGLGSADGKGVANKRSTLLVKMLADKVKAGREGLDVGEGEGDSKGDEPDVESKMV